MKWARLLERTKLPRPEYDAISFEIMDGWIGAIIAADKATLHELRTIYTLEDALMLLEVILVTRYNEYLSYKHSQAKMRNR